MNASTRNQAGQNPEMEMELLKIYMDEWKFRQDSLWRRITQFFVIIFFVSTLPVTVAALSENVILPDIPKAIFPLCGIALSIFFVWFCFSEAHRIAAIDSRCKEIIKNNFPSDYQKNGLPVLKLKEETDEKGPLPIFQWRMSIWVPVFLASIEIIIAITMLILVTLKMIYVRSCGLPLRPPAVVWHGLTAVPTQGQSDRSIHSGSRHKARKAGGNILRPLLVFRF